MLDVSAIVEVVGVTVSRVEVSVTVDDVGVTVYEASDCVRLDAVMKAQFEPTCPSESILATNDVPPALQHPAMTNPPSEV